MQSNMTQEYAHSLFEYKDGGLYWKVKKAPHVKVGARVGSPAIGGYETVYVDGRNWRIHRLVFLMQHGYLPKNIDHINGIRDDHRIENLRAATHVTNNYNKVAQSNNKLGIKNVSWNNQNKKYWVQLVQNRKKVFSEMFDDLELAELVAIMAREKYHGEFANHGVFK